MSSVLEDLQRYRFHQKTLPERMWPAIIRYIDEGIIPGAFLRAIISNDLKEAVSTADDQNIELLHVYVGFFYNYAPSPCYGSKEKMMDWVAGFNTGAQNEETFCNAAY